MTSVLGKASSGKNNAYFHLEVLEVVRALPRREDSRALLVSITSSAPGEGKTFAALTLVTQLGLVGEGPVLLVDNAFGTKGSVTELLAPEAKAGWPEVVRGNAKLSEVLKVNVVEGVDLLPGPASGDGRQAIPLLRSPAYRALLEELRSSYRLVVADGLSLSSGPVELEFMRWCDGLLLVLEYGKSSTLRAREYLNRLGTLRDRVLGVVINRRRYPIPGFLYRRL